MIDAGISCRETEKRMRRLGLSIKKVKAVFITHEHSDHIAGIAKLVKRFKLPVYVTPRTRQLGGLHIEDELAFQFRAYEPVQIGGLTVTGFPKVHDACDPHSFIVSDSAVTVGVFTDIGLACNHVIKHFKQCHAAFLESNYDVEMLDNGSYPMFLKNRIRGGNGHLSNVQAFQLFTNHKPSFMSHLFLSHLSKKNNDPEIVEQLFNSRAGKTKIIIASRNEETDVYHIRNTTHYGHVVKVKERSQLQLTLFGA